MAMSRAQFTKSTLKAPKSKKKEAKAPAGPNKGKKTPAEPMVKDRDADKMAKGGKVRGQGCQSRDIPFRKNG